MTTSTDKPIINDGPALLPGKKTQLLQQLIGRKHLAQLLVPWGWYTSIFTIPAISLLYVKYQLVSHIGLAQRAASCACQTDTAQVAPWQTLPSWWTKLSIYRQDLLFVAIYLPLTVLWLMALLPRRLRGPALAFVSILLFLVLLAETRVFWVAGRFLSWEMAKEALSFAANTDGIASAYIGTGLLVKALVGSLATVLLTWWVSRGVRRARQGYRCTRSGVTLLIASYGALFVATCLSWLPNASSTSYNRGALALMHRSLCEEEVGRGEFAGMSPTQLVEAYRLSTGSPTPRSIPDYWAQAKDCDIILFVMETAPTRFLQTSGDLSEFPNVARLCQRAWIANEHYTTSSLSRHAHFSILTSWYPSESLNDFPHRQPDREFPGLMQSLKGAGYETAIYVPDPYTRNDQPMHANLGIGRRVYTANGTYLWDVDKRIEYDRAAFQEMRQDIARWNREKRRFAALFLPQIGHGPLADVKGDLSPTDSVARGRAIVALQDAWLGELLEQLENAGRLDKTLIVVTGDHGVRTTEEDPRNFEVGLIQDYTFHVPLVLYAPPVLACPREIPWTTSHIDLSPSLLDLVGVAGGRASEQGTALWDPRLTGRTIFFSGRIHLGAVGYKSPSGCGMWNPVFDDVYAADTLVFDRNRPCLPSEPAYCAVKERLQRMAALQETWATEPFTESQVSR